MAGHESTWDATLKIKTTGRDETNADEYHHPYEPTPYSVLERLADSGLIKKGDGIQAVYGPKADVLKSDINHIL